MPGQYFDAGFLTDKSGFPSPSWLGHGVESVERLGMRLRRHLLRTFPLSHFRSRDYRSRLAQLPAVSTGADKVEGTILSELRGAGASFLLRQDLMPLLGLGGAELVDSLAHRVRASFRAREKPVLGSEATLAHFPGIWRLGLAPRMLDLAQAYLGLSCFYLGATVKHAPTRPAPRLPQWHLDEEDERVFRVLVYLTPVGAADGPFEFVPRLASQNVEMRARYRSGQIPDASMRKMVPRVTRRVAYGEPGDAVIFDGAQIFHRNRPPTKGERYSITFAYCSRQPLALDPRRRLSCAAHAWLSGMLAARQRDCLPPPRRF